MLRAKKLRGHGNCLFLSSIKPVGRRQTGNAAADDNDARSHWPSRFSRRSRDCIVVSFRSEAEESRL